MLKTTLLWLLVLSAPAYAQGLSSEFLFDIDIEVAAPHVVGKTRLGDRDIYQITGGRFEGPTLKGKVLNGADWALKRGEGSFDLDVRLTLETDQGDMLYMHYTGFLTMTPEMLSILKQKGTVADDQYTMITTARFEVSASRLAWLNTTVFVGVGRITKTGVAYRVYAIR